MKIAVRLPRQKSPRPDRQYEVAADTFLKKTSICVLATSKCRNQRKLCVAHPSSSVSMEKSIYVDMQELPAFHLMHCFGGLLDVD